MNYYGEAEFWLSLGKVLLIIICFSFTFITMVGGNPQHDAYGFRTWKNPVRFSINDSLQVNVYSMLTRFRCHRVHSLNTPIVAVSADLRDSLLAISKPVTSSPVQTIYPRLPEKPSTPESRSRMHTRPCSGDFSSSFWDLLSASASFCLPTTKPC